MMELSLPVQTMIIAKRAVQAIIVSTVEAPQLIEVVAPVLSLVTSEVSIEAYTIIVPTIATVPMPTYEAAPPIVDISGRFYVEEGYILEGYTDY